MKRYEGEKIKVAAFKRGGYFILRIKSFGSHICATRKHGETAVESWWSDAYEKKFESKVQANRYFKAIKNSNPDMVLVSDEPNKYISYDGKAKEY